MAGQSTAEELTSWFVCGQCGFPLVSQDELIEQQFQCWKQVTWAYELSVLGRDAIWCYSATNAHDHRFDVVRVLPTVQDRSIRCIGEPTAEYSWFPGYSWSMAYCRQCDRHLGWGFSPDKEEEGPEHDMSCSSPPQPEQPAPASGQPQEGAPPAAAEQVAAGTEEPTRPSNGSDAGSANDSEPMDVAEEGCARVAPPEKVRVELAFFGLVLTKLREKDFPKGEAERNIANCRDFRSEAHWAERVQALIPLEVDLAPSEEEEVEEEQPAMTEGI